MLSHQRWWNFFPPSDALFKPLKDCDFALWILLSHELLIFPSKLGIVNKRMRSLSIFMLMD